MNVFFLLVALFSVPAPATTLASAEPETAKGIVHAIEWRLEHAPQRSIDLESLLAFRPGDAFSESAVRRTLSNLYATGLFSEAAVYRRLDPEGWTAIVALRPAVWVRSIAFEGELGLGSRALRRALLQNTDAPLSEERMLRSVYALQDLYARSGYRRARVRLDVREVGKERVDVVFQVRSGERSRIGEIRLLGVDDPVLRETVLDALRIESGDAYRAERFEDDVERIARRLDEEGYRGAQIDVRESDRETEGTDAPVVDVVYEATLGQRILVDVEGADRKRLEGRGVLPVLDMPIYDEALVARCREQVAEYFQREGHYQVQVDLEESAAEEEVRLTIQVDPGKLYRLEEIEFEGNRTFTGDELKLLMSTSTEGWGTPRLVREDLNEDLDNLRSFYALQGFASARVGPPQIVIGREDLRLKIPIEEGPRQRTVRFEINGIESFDAATVRAQLPLRPGGPYHPALLEDTLNLLRGLYDDIGRPLVLIEPVLDWDARRELVDVRLEIDEGPLRTVDRILLRGYRRTRPQVIESALGLGPGDPISRRALLEAERNLYQLGIFSRVDVDLAAAAEQPERRDVTIRLEEGRRWRVGYGVSYHSDDGIGGLLTVSRTNLRGRAERFQLDLRASERDRRFRLIYDQPMPGGRRLPITYTLFRQDEERESFSVDEFGGQIALTRRLPSGRMGLAYDYRLVELSEETIDPNQVDREDRDIEISSITPHLSIDRRDNPLDPTRGWSTLVQLEYAFPVLQATADFVKVFAQQTWAVPLGRFGVLAGSVRGGIIEPLDPDAERDPLVPPELASSLVPASERFFAGGRTTHRAYERDLLGIFGSTVFQPNGPRSFTVASGGNGLVLLNLDYRFPIRGSFGGTVFFDTGNVWADWEDVDLDDLKPGAGLGVRYASPIGPVRLEIGWKLDRETGEDEAVFFLSFGNPF